MIVPQITAKSKDDFIERVQNGDLELARAVIRTVIRNLNAKNQNFIVAEIAFEDEGDRDWETIIVK